MAIETRAEYSEFEIQRQAVKFAKDTSYLDCSAVGSCEEELENKVVTKKKKGIETKVKIKGTGTGTLKLSLHMPYEIFTKVYGMEDEKLVDGVVAYGSDSRHKEMSVVQEVLDEDDVVKLKAYPRCVVQSAIARKIENGGEEVAESEIELKIMPDAYGKGMYEYIVEGEDVQEEFAEKWMTEFEPKMVRKLSE